jgi:hypothetical protein
MCTVTYLTIYKDGFILTSSRDEKAIRPPALAPQPSIIGDIKYTFRRTRKEKAPELLLRRRPLFACSMVPIPPTFPNRPISIAGD